MPDNIGRRSAIGYGLVALAGMMSSTVALSASAQATGARPNIVVFLGDDLGLLDTGPYGRKDVRTPNLDKLAAAGQAFDRAFVSSPACAPSAMRTAISPVRCATV